MQVGKKVIPFALPSVICYLCICCTKICWNLLYYLYKP